MVSFTDAAIQHVAHIATENDPATRWIAVELCRIRCSDLNRSTLTYRTASPKKRSALDVVSAPRSSAFISRTVASRDAVCWT